jgi:hypothetical protein
MLILMLETRRGSEDGFSVRRFLKDHFYDIADTLASAFINAGWALAVPIKGNHHVHTI